MTAMLIGTPAAPPDEQDLTAQRERLIELGVAADRIYLDHGLTGTNRHRPGLGQTLAAIRIGDTLGGHLVEFPVSHRLGLAVDGQKVFAVRRSSMPVTPCRRQSAMIRGGGIGRDTHLAWCRECPGSCPGG